MTSNKSTARTASVSDKPIIAVTTETGEVKASKDSPQPFGDGDDGGDLQIPEGVEQFDPAPPPEDGSDIVSVVPTSNSMITVPSGASFQLSPGVELRMQKQDAEFLAENGLA